MSVQEELHTKYDFILRPIKDLIKNWEVDVSHVLEQYMGEIEKLSLSVNNGSSVVNFAEASLLIQGSACVWSRKVEYLHMLIKKSLDMIVNKRCAPEQNMLDSGNSSTINGDLYSEECQLLKLDDISISSERLMTGKCDSVTRIPLPPPSILEVNADDRGRIIIMDDKADVCYSNDFWENHFIPFNDKVSILDRDAKGALHKIVVSCPQWHSEISTPVEQLSTSCSEPDPHDESVQDFNVTPPMEIEHPHEEIQDVTFASAVKLRPRILNGTSSNNISDDTPVRMLDPYQECTVSSWVNKKHQKLKSYRLPLSLSKKTRKRKHDGAVGKYVETINDYMTKLIRKPVAHQSERNCLLSIMESEEKKRNALWKSINDRFVRAKGQNVFDDDENEFVDCGSSDDYHENSFHSHNSHTVETLNTDVENHPVASYEDLVHHVVEKFYFSAQKYKEENALAQRIKKWDEFVTPSLEAQNNRPPFDIHRYGDIILKQFSAVQESKLFEDTVDSFDTWHICRLFAATLQLANDENFTISSSSDLQNSINTMELKLQNQRRLCDRFSNYTGQS